MLPITEHSDLRKDVLWLAIQMKRSIRLCLEEMIALLDERRTLRRQKRLLEARKSPFDQKRIEDLQKTIAELDAKIEELRSIFATCGQMVADLAPDIDEHLSRHDQAQILGVNHIHLARVIAENSGIAPDPDFSTLVFALSVEDRTNEEFIPQYHVSMPFRSVLCERMMHEMLTNRAFANACNEQFVKMVEDKGHALKSDENGVLRLVPKLRVVEKEGEPA